MENPSDNSDTCRLDVWLYRTRFIKSRSLATKLVSSGRVRLTRSGETMRVKKPHQLIKPGQTLTFMRGPELINVEMVSAGTRRGPAPEAQSLYRLLTSEQRDPKSPLKQRTTR